MPNAIIHFIISVQLVKKVKGPEIRDVFFSSFALVGAESSSSIAFPPFIIYQIFKMVLPNIHDLLTGSYRRKNHRFFFLFPFTATFITQIPILH